MPTIDMGAMTPTGPGVLVDKTGNIFSSMTAFNGTGTVTPSTPANCASSCTQLMPTIDMGAMTPTGPGVLVDKTGNIFSSITAFNGTGTVTPSTPANCASSCTQLVNQYNLASYIGTQIVERT
eukprot:scaffold5692_cov89-Cyclotella_meneghiniana.AAC.2